MNKKEKAELVIQTLEALFPNPQIPLHHKDSYTLLIAVVLSAQCTDARVNEVTKELFKIASTPEEMSSLSLDEIERVIRPCGLGRTKARALKGLSQILIDSYQSKVPSDIKAL